ncbi:hypothetical protein SDC9_04138 [bioreactor metagenome]|uniref:Uncharacterized protein n=1 Tax=bioreactor metagenome TaxID=1076179 RepID=A0A644SVG0_9ZZZZ
MTAIIILIGLLFSVLSGYLCFGLADAFFKTYWVNWLFAMLGSGVVLLCTSYILFANTPTQQQKKSSRSSMPPLLLGILLGSWWSNKE